MKARTIKGTPFCWQQKTALRLITERFSEGKNAATARSVYVALTELASDAASDTFTERKALIAFRAGVSLKTTERVLKQLEGEFISVQRNLDAATFRAPSTYTLLAIRQDDATIRHRRKTLKTDKVEEHKKGVCLEGEKKEYVEYVHTDGDNETVVADERAGERVVLNSGIAEVVLADGSYQW